jgi:hypothetical protein
MSNSVTETMLVIGMGILAGTGGLVSQCLAYERCKKGNTCISAAEGYEAVAAGIFDIGGLCSFTNRIPVTSSAVYEPGTPVSGGGSDGDVSGKSGRYAETTRSVCAPGERLTRNAITAAVECAPWRTWPDALDQEIMDPSGNSLHMRTCGKWIAAGPVTRQDVEQWSFYDSANQRSAVQNADSAMFSSVRLTGSDMGKVYSSCQQAVVSGSSAILNSAKSAYAQLVNGMPTTTTPDGVLEAVGWLSSHHCDGALRVGTTITGDRFYPTLTYGAEFDASVLSESLFGVNEPAALQTLAEQANAYINANAATAPVLGGSQMNRVLDGALAGTSQSYTGVVYVTATPEADALYQLVQQSTGGLDQASAYLKGVAAHCSFSMQSMLVATQAGDWTARSRSLLRIRARQGEAVALGRLRDKGEPLADDDTNTTLLNASAVTWSQLISAPIGDATQDCTALVRFLFPDRMDEVHFNGLVTDHLYGRVEGMAATLKQAVAYVVEHYPEVSSVLQNPSTVAQAVQSTVMRIPGAPRGTWAGIPTSFAAADLSSDDTVMEMALKQSRTVFVSRMQLATSSANPCEGPALMDGLVQNAYIFPGRTCTHLLLGLLRKPFADERYTEASLFGRVGYVIAHEYAHNTLNTAWNMTAMATLLSRYTSPNLYVEAIADVVAAMALIHTNVLTPKGVCEHVSQMWCGRTPLWWQPNPLASHPEVNVRGDWLCETLGDLGYEVSGA